MSQLDEFINPKAMVTPGAAGAVVMLISNTLWVQFALPQRWAGLAISFALGLLVFKYKARQLPVWEKFVYYVVNSLIIFSMGLGANTAAKGAVGATAFLQRKAFVVHARLGGLAFSPAFADGHDSAQSTGTPQVSVKDSLSEEAAKLQSRLAEGSFSKEEGSRMVAELLGMRKRIDSLANMPKPPPKKVKPKKKRSFFDNWF